MRTNPSGLPVSHEALSLCRIWESASRSRRDVSIIDFEKIVGTVISRGFFCPSQFSTTYSTCTVHSFVQLWTLPLSVREPK